MDPLLQPLMGADRKMIQAYGDTIRQSNSTQLDGSIPDDKYWQDLHQQVTASMLPLYSPPSGPIKNQLILTYTQLLFDNRERRCNSEKALIFASFILRKAHNKTTYVETKPFIK